jgi:hypothetical protein
MFKRFYGYSQNCKGIVHFDSVEHTTHCRKRADF